MRKRGAGGGRPGGAPRGPVGDDPERRERARRALHEALDRGEDPERAARAALRVSDECVEAWLLLADFARTPDEARGHVREAVAVSTHVLGEARLRAGRGRLGDDPDGSAHLHALAALARHQVAEGRVGQAVQTFHGIVALDPRDPVQVRGDLLLLLLSQARDDEAEELLAEYPEEAGAEWMYGRALLRRRRAGDAAALARAEAALDRAIALHPAAGGTLLAKARAEGDAPGEVEGVLAVAWHDTEGAVGWLADRLARAAPGSAAPAPPPVDAESDRRFSAREHVEEGWDAPLERRAAFAETALAIWPDCAEAWRLLASVAPTPAEAVARLREAVRAAERAAPRSPGASAAALGEREETREGLRARRDLARALRRAGDEEAALAEERRLLEEDPDDALGVGVPHVARLLATGRDADADRVLETRAEDVGPGWAWARVLARRRAGDAVAASFALADAMLSAPLVAPMLLGVPPEGEGLPENADAWVQARRAADALRAAWAATPGALAWLRERLPRPPPRTRSRPPRAPRRS